MLSSPELRAHILLHLMLDIRSYVKKAGVSWYQSDDTVIGGTAEVSIRIDRLIGELISSIQCEIERGNRNVPQKKSGIDNLILVALLPERAFGLIEKIWSKIFKTTNKEIEVYFDNRLDVLSLLAGTVERVIIILDRYDACLSCNADRLITTKDLITGEIDSVQEQKMMTVAEEPGEVLFIEGEPVLAFPRLFTVKIDS